MWLRRRALRRWYWLLKQHFRAVDVSANGGCQGGAGDRWGLAWERAKGVYS